MNKKKVLIPFVEGETEQKFYDRLICHLSQIGKSPFSLIAPSYNVTGIGGFKRFMPIRLQSEYFDNDKYSGFDFYIVFFYDQDVFRRPNPPVDFRDIEKSIRKDNPNVSLRFIHIQANQSVEDIFLSDCLSLERFLHIKFPTSFTPDADTGAKKMEFLYGMIDDFYIKGSLADGLSECFDMNTILSKNCHTFSKLCSLFQLSEGCNACLANRTFQR